VSGGRVVSNDELMKLCHVKFKPGHWAAYENAVSDIIYISIHVA